MSSSEALDKYLKDQGLQRIPFQDTEYAWGYRENEPVFVYLKGDAGVVFQTAMGLYWASADYIVKPWCLLLDAEGLMPHHRGVLDNLAGQFNIQIVSDETLVSTASEQLTYLTSILSVYIPEKAENPSKALGESISHWRENKPTHEYSFKVNIESGNLDVYKENGELIPSRKTIPLTAVAGDTRVESILPRLISVGQTLYFDTEHRNLPIVFKLSVGEDSTLTARFEADKSNLIEASGFWRLIHGFYATDMLAFIEPNIGDILFNCVRGLDEQRH